MSIYKTIKPTDFTVEELILNGNVSITSSNNDLKSIQYVSGSSELSSSYYSSLLVNFYLSGSKYDTLVTGSSTPSKYHSAYHSLGYPKSLVNQHRNKFLPSGSVISIPQKYFGQSIKPKTFKLTDNSLTSTIVIKDDGRGNLYPYSGFTVSKSADSSMSSSNNYVGNVFYNLGVVTLTTTESFNGNGDKYTDLVKGSYTVDFNSTDVTYTKTYNVVVNPNDFNITNNPTARKLVTGSKNWHPGHKYISDSDLPQDFATGSNWAPYMTTIGFYDSNDSLVMVAKYPQPIKIRKDMRMVFKIKQDW